MDFEQPEPVLIQERRLIKTMITGKPGKDSFLIAVMTVFVMGLITLFYWRDPFGWSQYLPAIKDEVFAHGQLWRIFTALFIHADLGHYLSNMYMLSVSSFFIFGYFGFTIYPLTSFLVAAFVNLLAIATYSPDVRLLGASGLVYVLGGFWLTMYFLIQRQYKWLNRTLRVVGISFMIFAPSTFVPNTSYRTHALGFAAGIIMAFVYFYKNRQIIRSHEVYSVSFVEARPAFY